MATLFFKILLFALAVYAAVQVAWGSRPSQSQLVKPEWFRSGRDDAVFLLLYHPDGTPRKFTWLVLLAVSAVFLFFAW
jgi:hypothetical protein